MTRRRITSVACVAALTILGVAAAPASAEIGLKPGTDFDFVGLSALIDAAYAGQ